ncbi:MAG: chromosomal replication initiator protein DnaA [Desulfofustis sp.]|jgi:chromosomal replication initiator protein|nr:chromosomal replication initiator protein DnaA [Desulfofustis sp.]
MVWEKTKTALQGVLSESVFSLWIEPITFSRKRESTLVLSCPDRYFSAYVNQNYLDVISRKASEIDGTIESVVIGGGEEVTPQQPVQMRLPSLPEGKSSVRALHPRYTFADFMVGSSNILAQSACRSMSLLDDSIGPCLYINSSTGLGKTHLTHAIAHQILDSEPMMRLHYLTAQQFASEMVQNIRNNAMERFKRKYQEQCDILLVEDMQSLTGKKKTQEELNEVLDCLIKSGKRVVMTGNQMPRELVGIDEEFRSRMSSGLVTSIQKPDFMTRCRIVTKKAEQQNIALPREYVDYLANHVKGDVRKIESTVIAIGARAALNNNLIDDKLVEEVVRFLTGSAVRLSPRSIGELVCAQFRVSLDEMRSKSRKRAVSFPRQVAMYLCRKHTEETLADIGKVFRRDHSTVMHAIKVMSDLSRRDVSVAEQLKLLSDKVRNL